MYALPLLAIADQPCIPSDHLHVSAHLAFRVDWLGRSRGEKDKEGEEGFVKDL